jgi:peroxiredoxin
MLKFLCAAVCVASLNIGTAFAEGRARTSLQPWYEGPLSSFALDDLAGVRHDVAAQRGKVVLVHFFATWCEPCIPELTSIRELVAQSDPAALSVLAVDVGEVDARVRRFLEKLPVNFPVVLDRDRAVTKKWNVDALPMTYVFDAKLQPRLVAMGYVDWTNPEIVKQIQELTQHGFKQEEKS